MLGSEVTRRYGATDFQMTRIRRHLKAPGQSFGAFVPRA